MYERKGKKRKKKYVHIMKQKDPLPELKKCA